MRGLVRHHELLRNLPKPALASVGTATLGLNLLVFESLKRGEVLGVDRTGLFELCILLGGLYVLLLRETGRRGSPWVLSLPLPAKTLWTAHLRALVLAVSLLVLAMALVVVGFSRLLEGLKESEFMAAAEVATHFARPWLVLLAMALSLGSWRPALADPERAGGWNRRRWLLAGGSVVVHGVLLVLPLWVALVPVLAAASWARRQGRALPQVLSLAERPDTAADGDAAVADADGRRVLHWIIVRQLFKWPVTWVIGLPMVFLLGMVQGGFFSTSLDADFARYFNVWITIYLMVAFIGHFLENLHRVDHLPVSRALILRWLLVPTIAALLVGGGVGTFVDLNRPPAESIGYENDAEAAHHGLLVPPDVWRPAWGDAPAFVEAPWGERRRPARVTVMDGVPLRLWKPYTTVPEASADFVAWQISRAAEAVHGIAVDPDTIRTRYLVAGPDGAVQVAAGGLTLVADGLVPARGPVGPLLGLLLGTTVVLALLTCWLVFLVCGRGANLRRVRTAFWTSMAGLMALHMGGYALLMTRTVQDWMVSALVGGFAGRLGAIGAPGWLGTWLAVALASLLAWRLCARAFARVEAVRGGSKCIR